MDYEELKKLLTEHKSKIEEAIKTRINEQSTQANKEIAQLKVELEKTKKQTQDLDNNIKEMNSMHVPGLSDETKKQKFSWQAFAGAALAQSSGMNEEKAWANAGYEREILSQYAATQKDHIAGDGTQGGYLIPEEVSSEIIGMVIAKMPIMEMGPTKITGLHGDLPIPKQTSRNIGYWVGETEPPTESTGAFAEFTLRAKKAGALTKYSKRLVSQTRGTAENIIKENLTDSLALTIDRAYLSGPGSDSQPKGILNQTGTTVTPNLATNGARFRADKAASMIQALDVADELVQGGNFGFIMRPEVIGGMRRERIPQFTGQPIGQGMPLSMVDVLMSNEQLEQKIGYKIRTTTLLSNAVTKGTSSTSSHVIFGNWKQFFIGFWRNLEIRVSDQASDASGNSAFLKDQFYMVAFQEVDCNVGRATAFTIVDDAETNEALWVNG